MTASTLKSHRAKAAAKLENTSDPAVVAQAILELETSLRADLPDETIDALAIKLPVGRNSVRNLIWALRSENLFAFRQEPDPKQTKGGEVWFERKLVRDAGLDSPWANQIVVWSGFAGPRASAKRAVIDLGFREADGYSFELYELKLNAAAGKQHEAIVELASYIVGYLLARTLFSKWKSSAVQQELQYLHESSAVSREERRWLKDGRLLQSSSSECGLLNARRLKWTVVAPQDYFVASPEQCRIWIQGVDCYLADAPNRFGFDPLTMVCSFREMAFRNRDLAPATSLANLVRNAALLGRAPLAH